MSGDNVRMATVVTAIANKYRRAQAVRANVIGVETLEISVDWGTLCGQKALIGQRRMCYLPS